MALTDYGLKRCTKCSKEYLANSEFFTPRKNSRQGFRNQCKSCINLYQNQRYKKNSNDLEYLKKKCIAGRKDYAKHHAKRLTTKQAYNKTFDMSAYTMKRYYNDPEFRTIFLLRSRLRSAIKAYSKNGKIGRSKDYKINWQAICQKLGPRPGPDYQIDHIKPCCKFDHDDIEQVKLCWSPENLQWLPARENLKKGGRIC